MFGITVLGGHEVGRGVEGGIVVGRRVACVLVEALALGIVPVEGPDVAFVVARQPVLLVPADI